MSNDMRCRYVWCTLALLAASAEWCACASSRAGGLDPSREIVQYAHRAWTKRDGLPQNSVQAIAQTADGYMWFGTVEGLSRFDGLSFRTYNIRNTPALLMNYITALYVAGDSTLFVGDYDGAILCYRNGTFRSLEGPRDPERLMIREITGDRQGNIWASSNNGLILIRGDSIQKVYGPADGLPYPMVGGVCETPRGDLLVATPAGIWIRKGECFEPWMQGPDSRAKGNYGFTFATPHTLGTLPTQLLCDRDGGLWIGTRDKGLFRFRDGKLTSPAADVIHPGTAITRLYQDQRGSVWIGTERCGLYRYAEGRFTSFSAEDGLSGDEVLSLFEDREGNLWVGVSTAGVNRFTNSRFTTFRVGSSVIENMIWSVGEDAGGRILASTAAGRVFAFDGKRFAPTADLNRHIKGIVAAYHRDRSGALWIAGTGGLVRSAGGSTRLIAPGHFTGAAGDSYGRLWFTGEDGITVYDRGRLSRVEMEASKKQFAVRQVLFDGRGNLWLASRVRGIGRVSVPPPGAGPLRIAPADIRWLSLGQGKSPAWILMMSLDSLGGLWVTTIGAGVMVIRGDSVRAITANEGLPEEFIYNALPDDNGSVWFPSNNGVHRASVADLYACLDGARETVPFESFGLSDGIYSDEFNGGYQASAVKGRDGRLWFPTTAGVVMVDPANMPGNAVPPAVVIERIKVDNIEGAAVSGVSYPPGSGELEFHFMGLSFTAPERVRYRYFLEGFNRQWIEAGDRRDAFYTNIPPGTYRFRVQAANGDGVWNDAGGALAFTLRPHYYQTIWFALAIILAIAGFIALGLFMYKRYRDREVRASRLESELAHAQVQILEMQLQPHFLFNTLNSIMVLIRQQPDMASTMVARLSEFLRLTLDSAGNQEVPLRRELEFLDRYLHIERIRFGDRLHFEQRVDPLLLDALVPNLILQPLVENAIRHGVSKRRGPALITVSAGQSNGSMTIHVRDNGAGLSSRDGVMSEGIGLKNTRQRLRHLYGNAFTLSLESPPDGGVDVVLTLPYHSPGT